MSTNFVIGKGTKLYVYLPGADPTVEPVAATPTVGAAGSPKGATTVTIAPLPAGTLIPSGTYLNFQEANGAEKIARLTADAVGGDTALDVAPLPEAVGAGATADWPLRLRGRTNANLDRTGNRVTAITFDDDGYENGLTSSISNGLTTDGNWLPLDAGYATVEYAFNELKEVYIKLELPVPSSAYSKGRVYKGPASITGMPLAASADGVITGNVSLSLNGKPTIDDPVPIV